MYLDADLESSQTFVNQTGIYAFTDLYLLSTKVIKSF
jgi:hypothetical protein